MTSAIPTPSAAAPNRRVDALGLKCPLPALKARRALAGMAPGEVLEIVADDAMAAIDIPFLAAQGGDEVLAIEEDSGALTFRLRKGHGAGEAPSFDEICALDEAAQGALLALNNLHARETSWLDMPKWRAMAADAFRAVSLAQGGAFLIAFDQSADYRSPNYLWFRKRLAKFVYVDRIVVAAPYRGLGLARRLYFDLFAKARLAGHGLVVCEVNLRPANPASDRFHAAMGFEAMGSATLDGGAKQVRYLRRRLTSAQ